MLVLSRRKNECVVIDDHIKVTVVDVKPNCVRIGFEASPEVTILRAELLRKAAADVIVDEDDAADAATPFEAAV